MQRCQDEAACKERKGDAAREAWQRSHEQSSGRDRHLHMQLELPATLNLSAYIRLAAAASGRCRQKPQLPVSLDGPSWCAQ